MGSAMAYSMPISSPTPPQTANVWPELSTDRQTFDTSQSIMSLGVRSALCVPIMLGQTVAAFLYLDSRGDPEFRPSACRFGPMRRRFAGALRKMAKLGNGQPEAPGNGTALCRCTEANLAAAISARRNASCRRRRGTVRPAFQYTCGKPAGRRPGGRFLRSSLRWAKIAWRSPSRDVSGHGIAAAAVDEQPVPDTSMRFAGARRRCLSTSAAQSSYRPPGRALPSRWQVSVLDLRRNVRSVY